MRLYDQRPVYLGHRGPNQESREGTKIGWVERPRLSADGNAIYGDVRLLTRHPMVPPILQAAKLNPRLFGMSHDATGTADDSGKEITAITAVESCDVVDLPATTQGFFENRNRSGAMPKNKRRLREDDDFGPNSMVDDATPGASGGDPVSDAVDLLQQALDAGDENRHAPGYLKDLQRAIDLLTPYVGDDDDEPADTSSQESRRSRSPVPTDAKGFIRALEERARRPRRRPA